MSDVKVEWFSGSGAGGQNRNKTMNCCRMTHLPSGTTAVCQTRARSSSYDGALAMLTKRVRESVCSAEFEALNSTRKGQVGSGMRGDKIRTYRFQDDTVADHRSGKVASVSQVMKGRFDLLWE